MNKKQLNYISNIENIFFFGFVFFIHNQMILKIGIMTLFLINLVLSKMREYVIYKEIYKFGNSLDQCLEEMIKGNLITNIEKIEESLLSRIQLKLKRLYEIQKEYGIQVKKEKERIQELISDISHQLKTPIANIKMYAEIIQEQDIEKEKQNKFLLNINEQIKKLDFLIKSLIKMSRLESGIIKINKEKGYLFETVSKAVSSIILSASKKEIQIHVSCEEDYQLYYDKKWTEEAIFNILDNAVKYTKLGGSIYIKAVRQEMFTKISIKDNGIGIDKEECTKIFQRFYRALEVQEEQGVGIGLYLSRQIIALQKGYILVESKKGEGADFQIFLPNEQV